VQSSQNASPHATVRGEPEATSSSPSLEIHL